MFLLAHEHVVMMVPRQHIPTPNPYATAARPCSQGGWQGDDRQEADNGRLYLIRQKHYVVIHSIASHQIGRSCADVIFVNTETGISRHED